MRRVSHLDLTKFPAGLGRAEEAVREGKSAVELYPSARRPDEGSIRRDLARTYAVVGDHDAAVEQLELLLCLPADICGPYLRIDLVFRFGVRSADHEARHKTHKTMNVLSSLHGWLLFSSITGTNVRLKNARRAAAI